MIEEIWRDFLRKYDLHTTWYYQDENLAWAEYAILRVVAKDGYSDAKEAYLLLQEENHPLALEIIEKQMQFMSLDSKEQRLIFHEILGELLVALSSTDKAKSDYVTDIYDIFHAVAQSEEARKIKAFNDNFIYLPKCAVLEYWPQIMSNANHELYQKLILSKPKLAKACFNEFFGENFLAQI